MLLPLRERVRTAEDPLETAVRLAITGNVIDYGVPKNYVLKATTQRVLTQVLAVNNLIKFRDALARIDHFSALATMPARWFSTGS
jgi:uncharacterized protein with ATP-grasp and redox domains